MVKTAIGTLIAFLLTVSFSASATSVSSTFSFTVVPSAPVSCDVNVTGNASIQTAINSVGAGTFGHPKVVCLHGTFTGQTFHTVNYVTFLGDGVASTILDGGGSIPYPGEMTDGYSDGTVGVVFDSIKFQNYGGTSHCTEQVNDGASTMNMWDGWVLQNSEITTSLCEGVVMLGSSTVQNSLVTANWHDGILISSAVGGSNLAGQIVSGNEVSHNNAGSYGCLVNVAQTKVNGSYGASQQAFSRITNNYIHDMGNACTSVWSDSYVINWSVQGNTIINSGTGISDEISPGSNIAGAGGPNDFSHNVLNNNSVECIHISASGGATVHDNNCSVPSGAHAIYSGIDNRGDAQIESNVSFYANTVTFLANGGEGYGSWSQCSVGQSSHNTSANGVSQCTTPFATGRSSGSTANHFYTSNSTADAHFAWVTAGDVGITYFTGLSFSAYQGRWGQDASSTIQVGNGGAAGCTTAWSQANPNVCPGGSGW